MQKFLLCAIVVVSFGCGALSVLALQSARQKFTPNLTNAPQMLGMGASAPSQPHPLTGNAQECERRISEAVLAIVTARQDTTNQTARTDLSAIDNALMEVVKGNSRAVAIQGLVKQKRAHLATLRLPPAQKTQLMKQVDEVVAHVSWCVANS